MTESSSVKTIGSALICRKMETWSSTIFKKATNPSGHLAQWAKDRDHSNSPCRMMVIWLCTILVTSPPGPLVPMERESTMESWLCRMMETVSCIREKVAKLFGAPEPMEARSPNMMAQENFLFD